MLVKEIRCTGRAQKKLESFVDFPTLFPSYSRKIPWVLYDEMTPAISSEKSCLHALVKAVIAECITCQAKAVMAVAIMKSCYVHHDILYHFFMFIRLRFYVYIDASVYTFKLPVIRIQRQRYCFFRKIMQFQYNFYSSCISLQILYPAIDPGL